MKRIITVCDSNHFSRSALSLSCYLARLTGSKVIGAFPQIAGSEELPVYMPFANEKLVGALVDSKVAEVVNTSIHQFREACIEEGVSCKVIREHDNAHNDLVAESLFADLLVLDESSSFSTLDNRFPPAFIRSLIADAHCPIMIAPATFDSIEEIIFAYDGSASSMSAIKQFSYLFPQLSDRKLSVVEVSESGGSHGSEKLKAWLNDNYSQVVFQPLTGNAAGRLFTVAMIASKSILVAGDSGRSSLSKFFKPSAKDNIVKFANLPVFIAHSRL